MAGILKYLEFQCVRKLPDPEGPLAACIPTKATVEPQNVGSLKYGHLDKQDTISRSKKTYVDNELVTPLNCVHPDIP